MSATQPPRSSNHFTLNDSANLIFLIAHCWWLPWELLLRKNFGRRYLDLWLLPAALWPMFFAGLFFPEVDAQWSIYAFWFILVTGVVCHIGALRLDRKGVVRHSQYNGYPMLCSVLPVDEMECKRRYEVVVSLVLSGLAFLANASLGAYLLGAWVAGRIKDGMIDRCREEQSADLHDAYIEQQDLAERFRRNQ